jgi:hypothetical protein
MLEWMNWENLAKWIVLMLRCLMMSDEWSVIWWVLCPPRVRSMGRGKPSVCLTLCRKEVMKPETIPSRLPISKSAATRDALMIPESAATHFSSTISMSAANQVSLPNCVVRSESAFAAELCCRQPIRFRCQIVLSAVKMFAAKLCFLQRIRFCCRIVLSATKKCSLPNCVVYNESVFAIKLWCLQWISPLTILCSSESVRWQINVTSKPAFSN